MIETDAQLVQQARDGDAEAFEKLVRRHFRAAYAVALAVLGDPSDAEDICQDALIRALERLDQCRDPSRFVGWLLQIVRNLAHDALRVRRVRRVLPLTNAELVADPASPEREAERALAREHLLAGLRLLSEVQREVVLLHDLEGWRHREIASALQMPEGTVRYHLSLARRALRSELKAYYPDEDQA